MANSNLKSCSVSYADSYLYESFSGGGVQPKLEKCSRLALQDGKCILHTKAPEGPVDFNRKSAFEQALKDEVKALGVPLVRAVDFSPYIVGVAGFFNEIIDVVAEASAFHTVKFDNCTFRTGVFLGSSAVSAGFYDCRFGDVQFMLNSPLGYEFFRCHIGDLEVDNATFRFLNLHGTKLNSAKIRANADTVSLRGGSVAGRLEINSSTIRNLDLAYLNVEDWSKVHITGVTHPQGVRVHAAGSALNDATFYGVDFAQREKGGLILADEEVIKNPELEPGTAEQLKPEACQLLSTSAVAQAYRNFIDVFEKTRQYDLAEECFVAAMDVQRNDAHLPRMHRLALHLYDCASRYGSSYVRAASVLVLLLSIFMGLYLLPPSSIRLVETKQEWPHSGTSAAIRKLGSGALHSIEVATFLKNPLYETCTPLGKIVEAAEVVTVPAQAALLLFAIRRRFKR